MKTAAEVLTLSLGTRRSQRPKLPNMVLVLQPVLRPRRPLFLTSTRPYNDIGTSTVTVLTVTDLIQHDTAKINDSRKKKKSIS